MQVGGLGFPLPSLPVLDELAQLGVSVPFSCTISHFLHSKQGECMFRERKRMREIIKEINKRGKKCNYIKERKFGDGC